MIAQTHHDIALLPASTPTEISTKPNATARKLTKILSSPITKPFNEHKDVRFNDGGVDPQGRLYAGSMTVGELKKDQSTSGIEPETFSDLRGCIRKPETNALPLRHADHCAFRTFFRRSPHAPVSYIYSSRVRQNCSLLARSGQRIIELASVPLHQALS